jgi:hypothetical protein
VALAMLFPFSPNSQVQWLAWAFLGVILGGLGKVENTLAAGLVVGLIQTVCTALLPFDYVYLVLYLLLAAILILRREGLSRAARRALPVFSVFLIPPVRRSAAVGVLVWAFWLTVLAGLILYGAASVSWNCGSRHRVGLLHRAFQHRLGAGCHS